MVIPLGRLYRQLLLTWPEIHSLVPRVLASVMALVRWARLASRKTDGLLGLGAVEEAVLKCTVCILQSSLRNSICVRYI